MSQFIPNLTPESLRDKVVVITGGANGIGASIVELCHEHGACVCFGDVASAEGAQLARKLNEKNPQGQRVLFHATDVTDYQSVLELFDLALQTYGRIDHAVAAAGIVEIGNWFDPALTLESVRENPTTRVLEVNLLGCLYVARIASVYLRENRPEIEIPSEQAKTKAKMADRSILLISSVAGFKESPGLFVYQASKHGVLGLMRSLRGYLSNPAPAAHNLRVNAICPWMTRTAMVRGIQHAWFEAGLPVNEPADVAGIAAGVMVDETLNGKAMYVEGGRAWEIEGNLDRLEPQWLGEEPSRSLKRGQEVLGDGMDWAQ